MRLQQLQGVDVLGGDRVGLRVKQFTVEAPDTPHYRCERNQFRVAFVTRKRKEREWTGGCTIRARQRYWGIRPLWRKYPLDAEVDCTIVSYFVALET